MRYIKAPGLRGNLGMAGGQSESLERMSSQEGRSVLLKVEIEHPTPFFEREHLKALCGHFGMQVRRLDHPNVRFGGITVHLICQRKGVGLSITTHDPFPSQNGGPDRRRFGIRTADHLARGLRLFWLVPTDKAICQKCSLVSCFRLIFFGPLHSFSGLTDRSSPICS